MVYFRITDGCCSRKFWVNSHGASFQSLKEKVSSLFPDVLIDYDDPLHFHYYNEDGRCIIVATDTELQNLLSTIPEDNVWKFHVSDFATSQCKIEHIHNKCKTLKLPPLGAQSFPFGVQHSSSHAAQAFSSDPFRKYCFPRMISLIHPTARVNSQSIDSNSTKTRNMSTSLMYNLIMTNVTEADSYQGSASGISRSKGKVPSSIAKMSVPTGNLMCAVKRGWNPSKRTVLTSSRRSKSSGKVVGSVSSMPLSKGNMTAFPSKVASTARATKSTNTFVHSSGPVFSMDKLSSAERIAGTDTPKTTASFAEYENDKLSPLNSNPPDLAVESSISGGSTYTIHTPETTSKISQSEAVIDAPSLSENEKLSSLNSIMFTSEFRSLCSSRDKSADSKVLEEKNKSKIPLCEVHDADLQSLDGQKSIENPTDRPQCRCNTLSSVGSSELMKDEMGLDPAEFTKVSTPVTSKRLSVSGAPSVTIRVGSCPSDDTVISAQSNTSQDKCNMSKASVSAKRNPVGRRGSGKVHKTNDNLVSLSEKLICKSPKTTAQTRNGSSLSATFPNINESAGFSGNNISNYQPGCNNKRLEHTAEKTSGRGSASKQISFLGSDKCSSSSTNTDQLYFSMMSKSLSISDFAPFAESRESWKPKEVEEVVAENPGSSIERYGNWTPRIVETPSGKGVLFGPVGYCVSMPSNLSVQKAHGRDARSVGSRPLSEKKRKDSIKETTILPTLS